MCAFFSFFFFISFISNATSHFSIGIPFLLETFQKLYILKVIIFCQWNRIDFFLFSFIYVFVSLAASLLYLFSLTFQQSFFYFRFLSFLLTASLPISPSLTLALLNARILLFHIYICAKFYQVVSVIFGVVHMQYIVVLRMCTLQKYDFFFKKSDIFFFFIIRLFVLCTLCFTAIVAFYNVFLCMFLVIWQSFSHISVVRIFFFSFCCYA